MGRKKTTMILIVGFFVLIAPVQYTVADTISLPRTGQTTPFAEGDDGNLQRGVPWPSPRFTDNGIGAITDNLTGLMWLKDANCIQTHYPSFDNDGTAGDGAVTWQHALDFVTGMNSGTYYQCDPGFKDWRLPNVNELESLLNLADPERLGGLSAGFTNVRNDIGYWSSTTSARDTDAAWFWDPNLEHIAYHTKTTIHCVIPVRGTTGLPAKIWQTGQTVSYGQGDDGALQKGVVWPNPRFTVGGNCVTDALTGMTWAKTPGSLETWAAALADANGSNLCGYTDWRSPNEKELRSLVHYGQYSPAAWLNTQGFTNVSGSYQWSSSTYADQTSVAWVVLLETGYLSGDSKDLNAYGWQVRGGPETCSYSLSPTTASYNAASHSGTIAVTASLTACGSAGWVALSNDSWITATGSGGGHGTATYTITENKRAARQGTITIAGQTFTINQERGSIPLPWLFLLLE